MLLSQTGRVHVNRVGALPLSPCLLAVTLIACCPATPALPAPQTVVIQPICAVPGYVLQIGYRFGKHAKLSLGETAVRSTADMVKLGWKHDQPWGRINYELEYFVDFGKPETRLGPNHVFEDDDLALVARHDDSNAYASTEGQADSAYGHIASGEFITRLTVQPPAIVEFMVQIPAGRGMWPGLWLYDVHSGRHDASEIDVLESQYNAPLGQRDDRSKVYQYDHGPGAGRTLADPGGLDAHGGWWQPYGSLVKGDPGSDLSKRYVAYSVSWQVDRCSKYVDNQLGITRAFKWTGPEWPNIIVDNACGMAKGDWCGPISPATFAGNNSTLRIKWIRVFKPAAADSKDGQ
jgi:hypothetical protein